MKLFGSHRARQSGDHSDRADQSRAYSHPAQAAPQSQGQDIAQITSPTEGQAICRSGHHLRLGRSSRLCALGTGLRA